MRPLQDTRELATRCHPPAKRYAALEAGSFTQVSLLPNHSLRAACPHDQGYRDKADHTL